MYYKNTLAINQKRIMFIPYENAPIIVKNFFKSNLIDAGDNAESFVIYNITDNEPIPLGFCAVDNLNIIHSKYIEDLFQNTANFNDKEFDAEMYNSIQTKKCVHISQWQFDEKLREVELLKPIFSLLMTYVREEGKYDFIWCDGKDEIIFYPVNDIDWFFGYPSSTVYFAMSFYNE